MKQDRFLLGILIFIGILVIAAVVLFFVRSETPTYGPEDTPEGVLRNYALALQQKDYERAYTYLADKAHKPGYDTFLAAFLTQQLSIGNASLDVGSVQHQTDDEAWLSVTVVYAGSGPFDQGWSSPDRATLVRQNGAWKISYLPYPFWGWDWYQTPVEPVKP